MTPQPNEIPRALLVEDTQEIIDLLTTHFEARAYIIHTESVIEAIGMDWRPIALIILDYHLRNSDAGNILSIAQLHYPEMPIVLYTSSEYARRRLSREGYKVIMKPNEEDLIASIEETLESLEKEKSNREKVQDQAEKNLEDMNETSRSKEIKKAKSDHTKPDFPEGDYHTASEDYNELHKNDPE